MAHSVNTHPYSINELIGNSFQEKFRNMTAKYAVEVLNNYDDDKILQFVDNKRNTIVRIDNPSIGTIYFSIYGQKNFRIGLI